MDILQILTLAWGYGWPCGLETLSVCRSTKVYEVGAELLLCTPRSAWKLDIDPIKRLKDPIKRHIIIFTKRYNLYYGAKSVMGTEKVWNFGKHEKSFLQMKEKVWKSGRTICNFWC